MLRLIPARPKNPLVTRAPADIEHWHETRAETAFATQWMGDCDEYLAAPAHEIGRPTGPDQRELFVSCAPDLALEQQFEHLGTPFIAVHDIATAASRKLLIALAAAGGRRIQTLTIRRQGFGTVLAAIEFVELPTADGATLRLYSTIAEADTAARHGIARTLLAHSRLGVVMVGALPSHATATSLAPWRDAMLAGPWPNRELLLLPLQSGSTLQVQGGDFARGTGVNARVTPHVSRPADAWGYINGTWARLRATAAPDLPQIRGAPAGDPDAEHRATTDALVGRPERRARPRAVATPPFVAASGGSPPVRSALLERHVRDVAALPGVASCCIFEVATGRPAASAGHEPSTAALAAQGSVLLTAVATSSDALGCGTAAPDISITIGAHHLVLRALPGHPGHALHVAFDRANANLVLARLQLQRLDASLERPVVLT